MNICIINYNQLFSHIAWVGENYYFAIDTVAVDQFLTTRKILSDFTVHVQCTYLHSWHPHPSEIRNSRIAFLLLWILRYLLYSDALMISYQLCCMPFKKTTSITCISQGYLLPFSLDALALGSTDIFHLFVDCDIQRRKAWMWRWVNSFSMNLQFR